MRETLSPQGHLLLGIFMKVSKGKKGGGRPLTEDRRGRERGKIVGGGEKAGPTEGK